ncbi:MAG TPA: ferrochelatase [Polyangiaceae bacterium]
MRPRDGVLLVAHGTVENLDDMGAFLARIRGGRPAPPGFVEELRHRYEAIGGSPLLTVTQAQAGALAARLGMPVLVGMRLWDPGIEAALERAHAEGLERLCVLPLAPFSVHVYWQAVQRSEAAVRERGGRTPELVSASAWGTHPAFVAAHADAIRARASADALVVLTAHSLPLVALRAGDPYERLVRESAAAIGERLGRPYELAFQSQGEGTAEWLGPDLPAVLARARDAGVERVALAPFGFLGEHVETLYDLDIEARRLAGGLGLAFERVPALGTAQGLIDALEDLARRTLA